MLTFVTLLIGAAGALAASLVGFPAPFLTGPAIAVTLATLAGVPAHVGRPIMNFAMIVIGMNIGAGVTPEALAAVRQWPASFVLLAIAIAVVMIACAAALRRVFGYDRNTAILASAPGHLTYVLGLSADIRADIRTISLVQSMRVLTITLVVPLVLTMMGGEVEGIEEGPQTMTLAALVAVAVPSLVLGLVLVRLSVPAALLIGAMTVSTLAHLTGIVAGSFPEWLGLPAFVVMGAMIGSRFSGVTLAMLRSSVAAGFAATAIAGVIAAIFALATALWLDLPIGQLVIAFMPGGVEAMIIMAVIMDADPAFVAGHHIMRLFILSVLVPVMLGRRSS